MASLQASYALIEGVDWVKYAHARLASVDSRFAGEYLSLFNDGCFDSCINRWSVNQICHVIAQTCAFMGSNVITQSSTNQIHPAEIPPTSNL